MTVDPAARAAQLRALAATWRASSPAGQIPLIVLLIQLTGPAWRCLGTIAPVWRGVVDHDSVVALWWLLHNPTDMPCVRCVAFGRPAERINPTTVDSPLCQYHLGGTRGLSVDVGVEWGEVVVTLTGSGAGA